MEKFKIESEPKIKDISAEFLNMEPTDSRAFLRRNRKESILSITINWVDVPTAGRLKAFLEDTRSNKQKRIATIRATEKQHKEELNVFTSGVKWEQI